MWTQKHAPKSLNEFKGNPLAVRDASEWLSSWPKNMGHGLLIYGPPGTGKTTFVRLFCKEKRLALVESDASEVRSKSAIETTFGGTAGFASLFFTGKVIFFDEADALSSADRGGAGAIADIIKTSRYPVVIAANDAYESKLGPIRALCRTILFDKIQPAAISRRLKEISEEEKITADEKTIDTIARSSGGDLKAAINDLESIALGREKISYGDIRAETWRDGEREVSDTLKIIFRTQSAENAHEVMLNSGVPPDEMLQWLRENVPYEYDCRQEVATAYYYLSRADIFIRRIVRSQYWRYQAYASDLMSIGVAVSKKEKYSKLSRPSYPSKIRRMGQSRAVRAETDAFLGKIAPHVHSSRNGARKYMFLFSAMQKHAPEEWKEFEEKLGEEGS